MNTYRKLSTSRPILMLFAIGFGLNANLSEGQTIVFADADFNESDWTTVSFASAGGSASATRISSGGNPDAYLQISLSMQAGEGYAVLWAFSNSALYDPSSQGAIATVGYAEDVKQGGAAQAAGSALLQGGLRYWRFTWTTDAADWTTRTASPDVGSFGYQIDGTQDNGSNPIYPDFSATGAPITFGFYRHIQGVADTDFTTLSGIDNWQTTVTQVPEPGAYAVVLGVVTLTVVLYRKRVSAPGSLTPRATECMVEYQ